MDQAYVQCLQGGKGAGNEGKKVDKLLQTAVGERERERAMTVNLKKCSRHVHYNLFLCDTLYTVQSEVGRDGLAVGI